MLAKKPKPQLFIGLPKEYSKSGDYNFLIDYFGLSEDKINKKIQEYLNKF